MDCFLQVEGGESRCGAAPCWAARNLWDLFPQSCRRPWGLADTASGQSGCLSLWENMWGSRLASEPSVPCSLSQLSAAQEPLHIIPSPCTPGDAHFVLLALLWPRNQRKRASQFLFLLPQRPKLHFAVCFCGFRPAWIPAQEPTTSPSTS